MLPCIEDAPQFTPDQIAYVTRMLTVAYDGGFEDGLKTYAYMKDGTYYVGTTGTTLKHAIENRMRAWNYRPIVVKGSANGKIIF